MVVLFLFLIILKMVLKKFNGFFLEKFNIVKQKKTFHLSPDFPPVSSLSLIFVHLA